MAVVHVRGFGENGFGEELEHRRRRRDGFAAHDVIGERRARRRADDERCVRQRAVRDVDRGDEGVRDATEPILSVGLERERLCGTSRRNGRERRVDERVRVGSLKRERRRARGRRSVIRPAFTTRDARTRRRCVVRRAHRVGIESTKVRDGRGDAFANRRRREQETDDSARRFGVSDRRLRRRDAHDDAIVPIARRDAPERADLDRVPERRPRTVQRDAFERAAAESVRVSNHAGLRRSVGRGER